MLPRCQKFANVSRKLRSVDDDACARCTYVTREMVDSTVEGKAVEVRAGAREKKSASKREKGEGVEPAGTSTGIKILRPLLEIFTWPFI